MPPKFAPTRQRKHKSRARDHNGPAASQIDSNAPVLAPAESKTERELKKQALREELRQNRRISSQKQKRLDKYIDNKLKKDENLEYLRRLEQEKSKDDERKVRAGPNLGKRSFREYARGQKPPRAHRVEEEAASDLESEDSFEAEHPDAFQGRVDENDSTASPMLMSQGTGLARPLTLGPNGLPLIETRGKIKKRKKEEEEVERWEGFSGDENEETVVMSRSDKLALIEALVDDVDEYGTSSQDEDENEHTETESDESSAEDEDEGDAITSETSEGNDDEKPGVSAFKAWATQQLNKAVGHTPSYDQPLQLPYQERNTAKPEPRATSLSDFTPLSQPPESNRKAYSVHVERPPEIQETRSKLPILQSEQEIMEAIHNNPVVIIKGDTGSGKTTQIPQLLYEAGYGSSNGPTPGMIGITQPRRVAAVSMAKRVAEELGGQGKKVAHQIRFDSNVSHDTAIKFMTDGILLRELSQDLLLRKYSVLVIDEAHERSVNTDILIGILSKVVPARLRKNQFNPDPKPLKVVIMSATLNISDFSNNSLFSAGSKPPIVEAEGRQHRVTTHFALRSRSDYLEEVVEKVRRAHRKLPRGGILVFLTGQNEIRQLGEHLRESLVRNGRANAFMNGTRVQLAASETPFEVEDMEIENQKEMVDTQDDFDEVEIVAENSDDEQEEEFNISDDETEKQGNDQKPTTSSKDPYTSVHILPLYSQLPTHEQLRVFDPPPDGHRLIVLATNVAETSLTIPGIRYVFDTGRAKERKYNLDSGVQSFEIDYISKASAAQRAGRAGRTGPGHCWRLYTSAVYEQFFPEHAEPEILRAPAENVVLQLKSFKYPKPVVEFPFPSSPDAETLKRAEDLLKNLGALTPTGTIAELGKELSVYPLSPRLGKIMSKGVKNSELIQHVIALVAGLAVQEIFVSEAAIDFNQSHLDRAMYSRQDQLADEERDSRKQAFGRARATLSRQDKMSDAIKLLTAVSMYNGSTDKDQFCRDYFLRPKAMLEVVQLQHQLISIVKANNPTLAPALTQKRKASAKEFNQLNAICASGYTDQVAIRADLSPNPPETATKPRRSIDVPFLPLTPLTDRASAPLAEKAIFIHPSSVLAKISPKDLPKFVVYFHLQKAQSRSVGGGEVPKTRMFPLTPVDELLLLELAKDTALLKYGRPLPRMNIDEIRGATQRRECWVSTELRAGPGFGWPLPSVRVRQVMDIKTESGWRVEDILS